MSEPRQDEQDEPLDTIDAMAEWTGIPKSWWYAQTAAKTIPYYKCGKYVRFKRSEMVAWFEAQRRGPRSA